MRLYFIRHGQSSNNELMERTKSVSERHEDPDLTALGYKQIKKLAKTLKEGHDIGGNSKENQGYGITHVYTSLMKRAILTGDQVSKKNHLPLLGWMDIHEQGGIFLEDKTTGEKRGQPGNEMEELKKISKRLVLPPEFGKGGWWNRPHENLNQARERGYQVIKKLMELHGGTEDRVALISHNAFYACFMSAIFELKEPDNYWFVLNNTGISRIDFLDNYIYLVYQNDLRHLKPREIT